MKITFEKHDLEEVFAQHLEHKGVSMRGKKITVSVKGGRRGNPGAATATVVLENQEEPADTSPAPEIDNEEEQEDIFP